MHFEILVEDLSGKHALEYLVPKIDVEQQHTFQIHSYKGIGRIPKKLTAASDPQKRMLLDNLPRLLRGYGETFRHYSLNEKPTVVLVCDLDDRNLPEFLEELRSVLESCDPRPETCFCFAVEEGEAWLLGDIAAVKAAYPDAKDHILRSYQNDSICGTWETLAEAVYPGGSRALIRGGYQRIGAEKWNWAERICQKMDVENNASPSFQFFRDRIRAL